LFGPLFFEAGDFAIGLSGEEHEFAGDERAEIFFGDSIWLAGGEVIGVEYHSRFSIVRVTERNDGFLKSEGKWL
jgi:hypothetical protein